MAYKFSVGAYAHSGSLSSTSDITGSTTVSGAVGQFGTLTVATFSPANISSTNITASSNISSSTANFNTLTVGTFSPTNLTVTSNLIVNGNTTLGSSPAEDLTVFNSKISSSIEPSGSTFSLGDPVGGLWNLYAGTISGSSTLQVGGTSTLKAVNAQAVTATTLSASSNVDIGGKLTVAGDLTVQGTTTTVNSTTLEIKDKNIVIASGSVTSNDANGAGITLGSTLYQLKFVSGSMGTPGDSWQFSGSTTYTDLWAGNITGTSLLNTKIVESLEATGSATINISNYITLADSSVADITANLPASGPSYRGVTFKVKNVGTKSVFVKTLGGTIDGVAGSTGVTLGTQYAAATFVSDGADWFVF